MNMGLLTKEVEVNITSRNVEYFENLGYTIPRVYDKGKHKYIFKKGTTIIVKVSDLRKNSMRNVDIECDNCHTIITQPFEAYNKYKKEDGNYYCGDCASRLFTSGKKHYRWKSDLTDEERIIRRQYLEYDIFRNTVLKRDLYTCQCCGHKSTDLQVHHLNSYNSDKEGRVDVKNGITLCKNCHSNFHSIYGLGNNTKQQFEEWLGKTVELLDNNIDIFPFKKVYCLDDDMVFENTNEAARYMHCKRDKITRCCNMKKYDSNNICIYKGNTIKGKRFLWYDDYLSMSNEEIEKYKTFDNAFHKTNRKIHISSYGKNHYRAKSIICITTNEIFDTISEASMKYPSATATNISAVCNGQRLHAGLHPLTKEKLCWMYYDDYSKMTEEQIFNHMSEIKERKITNSKGVICITTKMKFPSIISASKYYNVCDTSIRKCCKGTRRTAGILPNGLKLEWMYLEDYIKEFGEVTKTA